MSLTFITITVFAFLLLFSINLVGLSTVWNRYFSLPELALLAFTLPESYRLLLVPNSTIHWDKAASINSSIHHVTPLD